jgi:hypothetical protein
MTRPPAERWFRSKKSPARGGSVKRLTDTLEKPAAALVITAEQFCGESLGPLCRGTPMASFQVYVHDDRCPAPRLRLNLVTDEVRLMGIAERVLAESDHYTGVEVFDQEGRRFSLGSEGGTAA